MDGRQAKRQTDRLLIHSFHKCSLSQWSRHRIKNFFFFLTELQKAFNLFDRDGSGEISKEELTEIMNELGMKVTEKDINEIMEMIDTSGRSFVVIYR